LSCPPFYLRLGLGQGVGERRGGAAARDELDDVVDAGFGAVQLDLLEAQLFRDVGEQLLHRRGGSLVDLIQKLGVEDFLVECGDELVLRALTGDEHLVLAGAAGGVEAPVVTAPFPLTRPMAPPQAPHSRLPESSWFGCDST
jgi:hypothetical protein